MGSKSRIREGIKYGMLYTLIIMLVGLVAIEVFAVPFSNLFGLSGTTQDLCISAMRIISISFIFAGANIAFQGIFQALNGGLESLVVSVCRQALFIFPFAFLFAHIAKTAGCTWLVWTTFPIAELLSFVIAVMLFARIYRKVVGSD
jgi:Na+-driven multidrug efflux pump